MSFRDLSIQNYYKTYKNDIVNEFYVPVLQQAVFYQRAVGFFSSTALIEMTKGLSSMIKNEGKIQFIVSPYLSPEDIAAIDKGYEKKKVVSEALLREFYEPQNYFQEERLNLLAYLIEEGILEIKVAFTPPGKDLGMFHEKMGIFTDDRGDKIVFTGSLNETINAFHNNYESIVVFKSWEESKKYVDEMQEEFELMWSGNDTKLEIIDFPDIVKERFRDYRKQDLNVNIDDEEGLVAVEHFIEKGYPHMPGDILRDYQKEAVYSWQQNGYQGIFDMATGTGKTFTALGAAVTLFDENKRLAIIIVCPYQHLVEQWVEDIEMFNMTPVIGYSASNQKDWKKRLKNDAIDFSLGIINTFCFVTTNATYSTPFVKEQMKLLGKDTLLIIDEAHNFGAPSLQKTLYPSIQYRLALSATLERYGDLEGTKCLKDYFGEKCIEYNLERAIKEGKLTPYYYYPVVIYLEEEELEKYKELSYLASKECHKDKYGKLTVTKHGEQLFMQRARIIAGAKAKLNALRKLMDKYKDDTHMLVYCGATKVQTFEHDISEKDEEGERQIVAVSKMLGHEFGMKVTHFTSNESAEEREIIKRKFATADPYQALVAIKCLDEGVNIPSIKTAFILASTSNPMEYIQRRGRVLRLSRDKPFAVIYDFITLARPLIDVDQYDPSYDCERSLAKKELMRIKEFGEIARNSRDADKLIFDLKCAYSIDDNELEGDINGNEFE